MSSGGFDGGWAQRWPRLLVALGASIMACGDGATNGNVDADGADADVPDSEVDDVDAEAGEDVESADADADASDGDAALPTTLTVLVTSSSWLYPGEFGPLPGATVALDAPDGRRIEQTTGADGRTTFEDLDWTMGPAAVTAYSPGLLLVSRVGLTGAESEVQVDLPFPHDHPFRLARLWGYTTNMADTSHFVLVTATVPSAPSYFADGDWVLYLVPDVPYSLVAAEFDLYVATVVLYRTAESGAFRTQETRGPSFVVRP
jgi:hypothetical protein